MKREETRVSERLREEEYEHFRALESKISESESVNDVDQMGRRVE